MNSGRWRLLGIVLVLVSAASVGLTFVTAAAGFANASNPESYVSKNYTRKSGNTYECKSGDSVQKTASDIANKVKPMARQFDSASGSEYLRYDKRLIVVSNNNGKCQIEVEDLHRYNNGSLIFLGPGFSPSSPRDSSGGSSGSGSNGGSSSGGSSGSCVK